MLDFIIFSLPNSLQPVPAFTKHFKGKTQFLRIIRSRYFQFLKKTPFKHKQLHLTENMLC